jgi:hypothetical protein
MSCFFIHLFLDSNPRPRSSKTHQTRNWLWMTFFPGEVIIWWVISKERWREQRWTKNSNPWMFAFFKKSAVNNNPGFLVDDPTRDTQYTLDWNKKCNEVQWSCLQSAICTSMLEFGIQWIHGMLEMLQYPYWYWYYELIWIMNESVKYDLTERVFMTSWWVPIVTGTQWVMLELDPAFSST